jgi:hypothetical protein
VSAKVKQGEIWVADADVVDHDWLVGEDIFVFGGHSTGGGRPGKGWPCVLGGVSGLSSGEPATRLGSAFLKAANHDRETSYQLFPPLLLNMSGAGRISRRSQTSRYSRESASSQRPLRSVISGRPQVSANVGYGICCPPKRKVSYVFSIRITGICFGTKSSILRLDTPDNPSKPCLSCTKQWCLNQNLPICAGASLGDTDPDTATGKEGDVEARCFRM